MKDGLGGARIDAQSPTDVGFVRILGNVMAAAAEARREQHGGGNAPADHHGGVAGGPGAPAPRQAARDAGSDLAVQRHPPAPEADDAPDCADIYAAFDQARPLFDMRFKKGAMARGIKPE